MNSTKSAARPWLLGCAVFSLALAPLSVSAQTSGPIKIGVIAEAQAVAGSSIPLAAQLAADEINAAGGLDGRKIEIFSYDNHSSAAELVRAFQRAVRRPRSSIPGKTAAPSSTTSVPYHSYKHYSMVDVLRDAVPADAFRDKIVFVGGTALGIGDLRNTPFENKAPATWESKSTPTSWTTSSTPPSPPTPSSSAASAKKSSTSPSSFFLV